MGDQVFVRGTVIENFDVLGGLDEDFRMGRGERRRAQQAAKQNESRDPTRDSNKNRWYQRLLLARLALAISNIRAERHPLHTPLAQRNQEVRLQSHKRE